MTTVSPRINILFIETNVNILWNIACFLSRVPGCSLYVASNPEEASAKLGNVVPDVLLYGSGFASTNRLLKLKELTAEFPFTPLIVSITEGELPLVHEYIEIGARECIYRDQRYLPNLRRSLKSILRKVTVGSSDPTVAHSVNGLIPDFQQGATVSQYKILKELTGNGVCESYKAEDKALGGTVVLKFLPDLIRGNADAMERVLKDSEAVAILRHPSIIPVYSIEEMDDCVFVVSKYMEGHNFDRELFNKAGLIGLIDAAADVADALHAAHQSGLVHRNLKPTNILVTKEGSKLVDFGFDKRVPAFELPSTNSIEMFPASLHSTTCPWMIEWMSPEQVRAEVAGPASDVFSLGLVLYFAATGTVPFTAADAPALMLEILTSDPSPPSQHNPRLPKQFDEALMLSLEKNPDRRPSASDFAYMLRKMRAGVLYALPDAVSREQQPQNPTPPPVQKSKPKSKPKPKATSVAASTGAAPRWRRAIVWFVVLMMIAGAGAYLRYQRRNASLQDERANLLLHPFWNFHGDPRFEYFSTGFAESLYQRLNEVGRIRVIYRSQIPRTPEESFRLAKTVLSGTVSRNGDVYSIQAELWKGGEEPVWQRTFEASSGRILQTRDQILLEIVDSLGMTLSTYEKERLTRIETTSAEAFDSHLKGRAAARGFTQQELEGAIGFFQKATAADPIYALPHADAAETWLSLGEKFIAPEIAYEQARKEAVTTLELDPHSSEGLTALGAVAMFYDWNFGSAEKHFSAALGANANAWKANHYFAMLLAATGRMDESLNLMEKSVLNDPTSPSLNFQLAQLYVKAKRYDRGIEHAQKTLRMQPNPLLHTVIGDAYFGKGEFEKAQEAYQDSERAGFSNALIRLATVYASRGDTKTAESLLTQVNTRIPPSLVRSDFLAAAYVRIGNFDKAFQSLADARKARVRDLIYIGIDPFFDPLRNDLRFREYSRYFTAN